ncbi:MAG: hypothetical protein AAFX00_03360 [Pseudomonadota bacterium]
MSQETYSPQDVFIQSYLRPFFRLLLLPYYAVVLTLAVFRAPNEIRWVSSAVLKQIKVPMDTTARDQAEAIKARVGEMLADGNLRGIADWLVTAEQTIDETKGGSRLYQSIVDAALFDQTLTMIEHGELDPPNSLDKVVIPFEDALKQNPDHHGVAALTALRHLQVGWTFRGCGFVYEITDKQWQKVGEHYSCAADILSRFDAEELQSPSLAMAAHQMLAIEGASSKLDAVFELWRRLDPMSVHMFMRHAFHCLPRWGGSYDKILVDARRLAADTADRWGMAAYALYLIQLSDCEPEILEHMDFALFEEGVHDLLARRNEPPVVNFWLRELNVFASAIKVQGNDTEGEADLRTLAHRLRSHVIRTHLASIDPTMWGDDTLPLALIANEFKTDILDGQTIVVGSDGRLQAVEPEPAPV